MGAPEKPFQSPDLGTPCCETKARALSLVFGGLNLDVLYGIPLEGLKADVGAGFGVAFAGSSALFSLRGLVGLEVPLQGALAVRVEPTLTYNINLQTVGLAVNLGPRVYLGR